MDCEKNGSNLPCSKRSSPVVSIDSSGKSLQSSGSRFCRICHDGSKSSPTSLPLVAPCKCTGSVALIHVRCLEHWLTTSNSDQCEICHYKFHTVREPKTWIEYFSEPSNQFAVRNLVADIICFLLLTPLLFISTYLCAIGASQYFIQHRWEAVGLVTLSFLLLVVYFIWCHVTTRYHCSTWRKWQTTHQNVKLLSVKKFEDSYSKSERKDVVINMSEEPVDQTCNTFMKRTPDSSIGNASSIFDSPDSHPVVGGESSMDALQATFIQTENPPGSSTNFNSFEPELATFSTEELRGTEETGRVQIFRQNISTKTRSQISDEQYLIDDSYSMSGSP